MPQIRAMRIIQLKSAANELIAWVNWTPVLQLRRQLYQMRAEIFELPVMCYWLIELHWHGSSAEYGKSDFQSELSSPDEKFYGDYY